MNHLLMVQEFLDDYFLNHLLHLHLVHQLFLHLNHHHRHHRRQDIQLKVQLDLMELVP